MSLQAEAVVCFHISRREFWSLTPPEFFAMRRIYRSQMQILDALQANISAWIWRVAPKKSSSSKKLSDFCVLK